MALTGKQFSHYRILHVIGKGGMGEVYLMEDSRVQRWVAAKFIRLDQMQEDQQAAASALHLFWREATAIAQFDHPAILPLYDHGETVVDGVTVAYLIMPYRPEGSLSTWLRQRAQNRKTQQLTLQQVEHVIQHAAQGLQHAHDHQIMHLDVKPANFLIRSRQASDDYPDLLLADFGIARLSSATSSSSQHARGTPTYMAPEQWAGQPGFASDQYALAIMASELLTGSPPFQGAPMSVMYAHVQEQPKSVCDHNPLVPPAADLVLQRALAKKPEERFSSVAAFAQAFHVAFAGMDESTSLRLLRPAPGSPSTPPSPSPAAPALSGDVRATLTISAQEARDGAVRTLNLPNGRTMSVQIPAGAQSNQVLLLVGLGETLVPGTTPGNLYLTLLVIEASVPAAADYAALTERGPHSVQASPPVRTVAPTQGSATLSPDTPARALILPESSRTLPPRHIPTLARRNRKPAMVRVGQMLLVLLVLGVLALGMYRGVTGTWFWNIPGGASTPISSGTNAQANATAAAQQAAANSTATAVAGRQPYVALLPGLCDRGGASWSGSRGTCLSDGLLLMNTPQNGASVSFFGTGTLPENYTVSVETSRLQGSVCAEFGSVLKNPANVAAEYRIELCSNATGLGLNVFYGDATGDRSIYQETIDSNGNFTLQIACQSPGCTFSVNGRQLTSLTPNQYLPTASILLGVSQGNTASGSAVFSNFIFTPHAAQS